MRFIAAAVLAVFTLVSPAYAKDSKLSEHVKSAVAILYSQDESGGMRMHCTLTAFDRIGIGKGEKRDPAVTYIIKYRFATAAHCIGSDDTTRERSADTRNKVFFITFDEAGKQPKRFFPARPIFVGYQSRGEDFAEFEVETTEEWSIVPLGDEHKASDGDDFLNVSAPLGLGKQVLHGQISSLYLDRPVVQGDINWKGSIVLQITGIGGGSSGSAIVHEDQKAIIGFLVGSINGNIIIAIPVSRFVAVRKAVFAGSYKYYTPTVNLNPDGTDAGQ